LLILDESDLGAGYRCRERHIQAAFGQGEWRAANRLVIGASTVDLIGEGDIIMGHGPGAIVERGQPAELDRAKNAYYGSLATGNAVPG